MNRNLVEIALQELEPEDRALLELSVVREVSDEDIAGLLSVDIAHVLIKREEALGRVAALTGEDAEDVLRTMRGLPSARWRHDRDELAEEPAPEPEPEPEPVPPPEKPDDRNRFMLALLGGLAVTLVVVVVIALNNDDDTVQGPDNPSGQPAAEAEDALAAIGGSGATGSAQIRAARLTLDVRGLPKPASGGYVVWVYNSVTDARPVAGRREGSFEVNARLPANYRRYRFVDVSREPADGNPNHSGQSVVRVPVTRIAR